MGHIISIWFPPHLDVRSSLAPALADLGCICPGLLQFVASLPCKDWSLIMGESLYGHDFIKIPNLRDFDNWWGLLDDLTLESIMNCHLVWLHASSSASWESLNVSLERVHACVRSHQDSQNLITSSSFNLSDGVWAVPQQCVIGQDVLKFSCLWFSFQISH